MWKRKSGFTLIELLVVSVALELRAGTTQVLNLPSVAICRQITIFAGLFSGVDTATLGQLKHELP